MHRVAWIGVFVGACASGCNACHDAHTRAAPTPSATRSTDVADAPFAVPSDADADAAPVAAPQWLPPGSACRHAIPHEATFAQVDDALLGATILRRYDRETKRVKVQTNVAPLDASAESPYPKYFSEDCRGDRVTYDEPLRDEDAGADTSDGALALMTSPVEITRTEVVGNRIGVYVLVAREQGFSFTCVGFESIVRLDPDEIIVEGVGKSDLYECEPHEMVLASLDSQVALLVPVTEGTGEDGDVHRYWDVELPSNGVLRLAGRAFRGQSAGNASTCCGTWFPEVSTKIVDAGHEGGLQVEETWEFAQYAETPKKGPTRRVTRTYRLVDGGLARSPKTDPTLSADPSK